MSMKILMCSVIFLQAGKSLYRKAVDGSLGLWTANVDDSFCTLAEAFSEVQPSVGFNIELKFDDGGFTSEVELHCVISAVLEVRQTCKFLLISPNNYGALTGIWIFINIMITRKSFRQHCSVG